MRNRVERLRIWLVGSAIFLVLVIAAFIGAARFLRRLHHLKLPANLGINIVRETNDFKYSQSIGSQTIYSIQAAKAVEHKDSKVTLHDVKIVLYGRKGDRHDQISGKEFEYDQSAGLIRAMGLVHIDLQSADEAAKATQAGASDAKVLHVTTSNLVYLSKLGVAATSEYIEFQSGGMTGHATGADYASDSGLLMLHSAVTMNGVSGGRPLTLTASTAQFDNKNQEALLTHASYQSEGRTAEADQAKLHSRPDGTLARVEAQGNVTAQVNGATVVSQRADVVLTSTSQPQSAVLTGGVKYSRDQPLRQLRGQADAATIAFDGQASAQPKSAVLTGGVHLTERTRATDAAREPWSTRDLTAAKFETLLAPAGSGKSQLRDAEATGSPHLTFVNNGSLANSSGKGTTEMSADDLKAHMMATGDAGQPPQLDTIAARGHTVLRQTTADGKEQMSSGDLLDAKFRPRPATSSGKARPVAGNKTGVAAAKESVPAGRQLADTIESAVQQGHVTMMRRSPPKVGTPVGTQDDVEHASAERAVFDGGSNRMTLSGGVQLTDAGSELWANQVVLDRETGDSVAVGAVKVEYVDTSTKPGAGAQGEPTHILAERAEMDHASEVATFHGKPVRVWQGGSQVQAPVVEIAKVQQRIVARGESSTGWSGAMQAAQVRTVLVSAGNGKPAASSVKAGAEKATARTPDAVRVASGGLVYSGILRQAEFTGGFRAETPDGTIRASQATAYLQDAGADKRTSQGGATPSLAGKLDHVVATGHVEIDQPGLHATGERLLYTASDQVFLLTGDASNPPKAVGARGTTTGAALRLRHSSEDSGSDSVEVLGEVPGMPAHPVRTDSVVGDDAKGPMGKR